MREKFAPLLLQPWERDLGTGLIKIQLNGEARDVPEGLTLAVLLEWLKLPADRVAVEYNLEIVSRDRWKEKSVQAGDRLEVVHFVGGGSHVPRMQAPRVGRNRLTVLTLASGDDREY